MYDDDIDNTNNSSLYETWDVDVDNNLGIGVQDGTVPGDRKQTALGALAIITNILHLKLTLIGTE